MSLRFPYVPIGLKGPPGSKATHPSGATQFWRPFVPVRIRGSTYHNLCRTRSSMQAHKIASFPGTFTSSLEPDCVQTRHTSFAGGARPIRCVLRTSSLSSAPVVSPGAGRHSWGFLRRHFLTRCLGSLASCNSSMPHILESSLPWNCKPTGPSPEPNRKGCGEFHGRADSSR